MLSCIQITITAVVFCFIVVVVIYLFIHFLFVCCFYLNKLLMSLRGEARLSMKVYVPSTVIFIVKFPITKP